MNRFPANILSFEEHATLVFRLCKYLKNSGGDDPGGWVNPEDAAKKAKHLASIGRCIPEEEVRIVDDQDQDVPI